jgi:quercetin dioxygenase-like cupin family protein
MVTAIPPKHDMTYAGATVRIYHANKGEGIPMHKHEYSHATMCMAGSCKLTQEDRSVITDKNSIPVNLLAKKLHEIEALEDNTIFVNIFAEGKY